MSAQAEPTFEGERVGGRYRVEAELGRGGAARVYQVFDERDGTQLALKKLVVAPERSANLQIMFEREYHTLAQLAHPRIVRVFDYGVDGTTPYYTMELLQGADARTTWREPTLPARHACVLLRDAASALALIHSRRMVHRDVSPRNLWCTPDGRAKLIDFGTLVAMGPQTRIAGTPPFVAPESVYMQPLEARSDLYSLGALAYYLLTKRNAYPAREIADLREVWQRKPPRPEQIREDLPPALCDLVMSLLSLDPRGRPASAAEVFERLSAIGELPADDERLAARAFLTTPQLTGREQASALLRKRLLRASRGRGGTAAIVARSGLGRSRMLESFVLEAKVAGATVVPLFATAVGSGPLSLAAAMATRLLELMPVLPAAMIDSAGVLGHLSPELHRALGSPALIELPAQERAQRAAAALVELIDKASDRRLLVIAVDDVHRADGASLGVLGRLSLRSSERSLLLVTTVDAGALVDPPPALEQLAYTRDRVELGPLQPEDTRALLEGLFGAAPGLDDAASWLHELSQGSPAACMQYAQYLVDQGIARFEHGRWELPERLRERGLPSTIDAMFEARLAQLSADARALALGLALARDESRSAWQPEQPLRIDEYPKLLENGDGARAFAAIDELLRAGVLQQRDDFYVLAQRALIDVLLRTTECAVLRAARLRLAELYEQGRYHPYYGVRQLFDAGEPRAGRERLLAAQVKLQSESMDWGAMRVSMAADCARRAIDHWQREGGSPYEAILLRRVLVLTSAVYDWSDARFGAAHIAQLQHDCGIDLLATTDPAEPMLQRVFACLKRAQERYDATAPAERGFAPAEAVRELAAATLPLSGSAVHSHDAALAASLPPVLEPLRPLSPLIEMLAEACRLAVDRVSGRELGTRVLAGADQTLASSLPQMLREGAGVVGLHAQAVEDARCGRERALALIDRIAPFIGDDMFFAVHGRWLGCGFRGDAARALRFRRQVEVITEDDVWRRKSFLFVEAELYALCGDLIGLRRTADAIAPLAATFPGWRPWLGYARAVLHQLRGELPAARAELESALASARAGEHRAWTRLAPAYAELLLQQGDAAAARQQCELALAEVERLGLDLWTAVAAQRIRALAASALGEHEAARAALERAFAIALEQRYGGLLLALLQVARARIALAAQDRSECTSALETLRALIELADAPALVHAYEALREQSSRQLGPGDVPAALTSSTFVPEQTSTTFSDVRTRLSTCNERQDRWRQALELVLEDSGAPGGHLFLFDANGLFPAASFPNNADQAALQLAQQFLETQRDETKTAAIETAELLPGGRNRGSSDPAARIVPALIAETVEGRRVLTGVALLTTRAGNVRMPRAALVQAISRCLEAAGDSIPLSIDD